MDLASSLSEMKDPAQLDLEIKPATVLLPALQANMEASAVEDTEAVHVKGYIRLLELHGKR